MHLIRHFCVFLEVRPKKILKATFRHCAGNAQCVVCLRSLEMFQRRLAHTGEIREPVAKIQSSSGGLGCHHRSHPRWGTVEFESGMVPSPTPVPQRPPGAGRRGVAASAGASKSSA